MIDLPVIKYDSSMGPNSCDLIANDSSRSRLGQLNFADCHGKDTMADDFLHHEKYPRTHSFDITEIEVSQVTITFANCCASSGCLESVR
jgi:hypothetical protein